jgi:hypothetical protein
VIVAPKKRVAKRGVARRRRFDSGTLAKKDDGRIEKTWLEESKKASDIARTLAFGGAAAVWALRPTVGLTPNSEAIAADLMWPLLCFAFALGFDALQYLASSSLWGSANWKRQLRLLPLEMREEQVDHSKWRCLHRLKWCWFGLNPRAKEIQPAIEIPGNSINVPSNSFFYAKMIVLIIGYILLAYCLWTNYQGLLQIPAIATAQSPKS